MKEDDNVVLGVSPFFYIRIKRDAANNLEMWIDDTNTDKVISLLLSFNLQYFYDVMYVSSSTDRKVRCRPENASYEDINSHKRFTFAENVPRLSADKLEVTVSVAKKTKSIALHELFPCIK